MVEEATTCAVVPNNSSRASMDYMFGLQRLSNREKIRRFLNTMSWQAFMLLVVLVDLSMLLTDVLGGSLRLEQIVTVSVLLVFVADLSLRFYALGSRIFVRQWVSWFDGTIVFVTLVLLIYEAVEEAKTGVASTAVALARASRTAKTIIYALRVARVVRGLRMLDRVGRGTQAAARQLTGENKKRFVDLENGFDLDLVYLSPQLIVMSVPAVGATALYRNPLSQVARFFETRHAKQERRAAGVVVRGGARIGRRPWPPRGRQTCTATPHRRRATASSIAARSSTTLWKSSRTAR